MAHSTTTRPAGPRQSIPTPRPRARKGTRSTISSMGTLARWQLRQTWRLLIVIGVGLLAAVALVGMIPLYAQVSESAGLRHALAADPQNSYIQIHASSPLFNSGAVNDVQGQLTDILQNQLGSTIVATPDLSAQIPTLDFTPNLKPNEKPKGQVQTFVRLVGSDTSHAAGHLKLAQGRAPAPTSDGVLEFAAPVSTQSDLHLQLGTTFTLPFNLNASDGTLIHHDFTFRLVGTFASVDGSDLFWHGETFQSEIFSKGLATFQRYPLLVSNRELMNELDALSTSSSSSSSNGNFFNAQFSTLPDLFWYYRFDFSHVDIRNLPVLIRSLNNILSAISHGPQEPPYVTDTTSSGPLAVMTSYGERVTVVNLPVLGLTYLIGGLVLFFVVLMTDLLVERQVAAITLLRSRGASGRQVFGSLLWQSLVLGLIAFVAGPLLAILLVELLVKMTLVPADAASLNLITADPLAVARGLTERDLIVVGLAVLAMLFAIWRVMRSNILSQRREAARTTQQPFWVRYRLDLVAAVLSLAGFGFSVYIASPGVLDAHTRVLISPLTSLVGVLFLLVGALLLFLRFFPAILRLGERVAARNRGIAPVLALAQMARSPRQSLRMTLLFALAVAFSLFTLVFTETQLQRLPDLTNYQVGSDISGQISLNLQSLPFEQQRDFFLGIKGVTAATLVMTKQVSGGSGNSVLIDMRAVDAGAYARTVYWTEQDSSQPISALTSELVARRASAEQHNIVPAILDDAAAQSLGVTTGQQFVLTDFHGPLTYVVTAVVHYIPTIYDTAGVTGSYSAIASGGVLVDYNTLDAVSSAVNQEGNFPDTVLIRTSDNPTEQANAHRDLFTGTYALGNPQDRRAILASLSNDPLVESMIGILSIGAAVALLLALLGNLLVSWLNARSRKTSFAIMRALGCTPRQIIGVLLYEQGIVYSVALALGTALGILFSLIILPVFVFTPLAGGGLAATNSDAFYVIQSVPAVHLIVPVVPVAALLAGLVLICVCALIMMVRVVMRPHLSQELRVDED